MPRVPPWNPDESAGYLYQALADHLEARIRAGELQPGTRLPAEREMASEYGVALHTVRHAQRILADLGLLRVLSSKGAYVTRPHEWAPKRRGRRGPR
jgi:GntR family transcriptional regulator